MLGTRIGLMSEIKRVTEEQCLQPLYEGKPLTNRSSLTVE